MDNLRLPSREDARLQEPGDQTAVLPRKSSISEPKLPWSRMDPYLKLVPEAGCPVHPSDQHLIGACLRGDHSAWNLLIERYGRLVYSIPRRYGLSEADADDVFANCWAAAFRHLEKLQDQSRLSSWLITTAHRECWRVSRQRKETAALDPHFADIGSPSEDCVAAWEQQHLVWQALDVLGQPCKDLLVALFLDPSEPNYQVVAARLGMKVGSIGATRARCFRKLEKILVELGLDPAFDLPNGNGHGSNDQPPKRHVSPAGIGSSVGTVGSERAT
jgi:RNA polymerase sigma factor (sigma-70 family)